MKFAIQLMITFGCGVVVGALGAFYTFVAITKEPTWLLDVICRNNEVVVVLMQPKVELSVDNLFCSTTTKLAKL